MRKSVHVPSLIVLGTALVLAACGTAAPQSTVAPTVAPTVTATSTPDPCSAENVPLHIKELHRVMREFDDAAALSANTARDQLKPTIADLQRIRRDAEDLAVPACLKTLREVQLVHMNTFIQTLLAFMGGAEQAKVDQGIALSRQLHNQYMIEMARVQGITVPPTPSPAPTAGTPGATAEAERPTPSVAIVTNAGPTNVNVLSTAALDAQSVGTLGIGQQALALGQTENGAWIMIEIPNQPGQTAWVYAALVRLSGPAPLPIIMPQ